MNEIKGSSFTVSTTSPNQYNVVPSVTNPGIFAQDLFDTIESSETPFKIDGADPVYQNLELVGTTTTI